MAQQADIFLVPLLDGKFGVGQIIVCPPDAPVGTRVCVLTRRKAARAELQSPLHLSEALSLVVVQDDHLKDGTWPIVGFEAIPPIDRAFKVNKAIKSRFDSVAIQDPAIIEAFVNALHGLYPWDGFPDPDFFTKLLITPDRIPASVKTKAELAPNSVT